LRAQASPEFFFNKGQLAQVMHIAPCLHEAVALIAVQPIMAAFATKQRCNANGIKSGATSGRVSCVVSESVSRADVDPPTSSPHPQAGFILIEHASLHQSCFELFFHSGQLLMAGFHKTGNAAR
jgi:hypothetical protein